MIALNLSHNAFPVAVSPADLSDFLLWQTQLPGGRILT